MKYWYIPTFTLSNVVRQDNVWVSFFSYESDVNQTQYSFNQSILYKQMRNILLAKTIF